MPREEKGGKKSFGTGKRFWGEKGSYIGKKVKKVVKKPVFPSAARGKRSHQNQRREGEGVPGFGAVKSQGRKSYRGGNPSDLKGG